MENPTFLRSARLITASRDEKGGIGFSTALSYEPIDTANDKGQLFIIVEIMNLTEVGRKIAQNIIETAKKEYYKDPGETIDKSLEYALMAVNDELTSITEAGLIDWIGKLSSIIAVIHNGELHLSKTGSAEAYLFRGETSSQISAEITQSTPDFHPLKTFSNIVSGEITVGDKILFTTPGLFYHLSLPELHNIIVENSPGKAIKQLADILERSNLSRASLMLIEGTTPEILSYEITDHHPSEIVINEPSSIVTSKLPQAKPYLNFAINAFGVIAKFIKSRFSGTKIKIDLPRFNYKKQAVFAVGFCLLVGSIAITANIKSSTKKRAQFKVELEDAKRIASDADTKVLFNRKTALGHYKESLAIVDKLVKFKYKDASEFKKELQIKIASVLNVFETNEEQIANLEALLPNSPIGIYSVNGFLYAFDSKTTVSKVNQESYEVEQVRNDTIEGNALDVTYNEIKKVFYILSDNQKVYSFNGETNVFGEVQLAAGGWAEGNMIETYPSTAKSSYIYILSTKNKNITYYQATNTDTYTTRRTYNASDSWEQAVDIAIDDSVYVLLKNNTVTKLVKRNPVGFNIDPLEPMTESSRFVTGRGFANIYVYDKSNNSISTFDKSGAYKQINPIKNCCISAFTADETKKVFYILIGKQLYTKDFQP